MTLREIINALEAAAEFYGEVDQVIVRVGDRTVPANDISVGCGCLYGSGEEDVNVVVVTVIQGHKGE